MFYVYFQALSAAQKVDKWETQSTGGDGESRTFDTFFTPLIRRVELIETAIANGTSAGLVPVVRSPAFCSSLQHDGRNTDYY